MKHNISTPIAKVSWLADGQIIQMVLDEGNGTVPQVQEHIKLVNQHFISGSQKNLVLFDIRQTKKVGKDSRDAMINEWNERYDAVAMLVGSALSKIIGGLAMKFSKPETAVKLFTDKDQAVNWLKTFL